METINFQVSHEKEDDLVGIIKFASGKRFIYFSELEMLKAYKENYNKKGWRGIDSYIVLPNYDQTRHGLQYELIKAQYEELGLEYLKLDYMRDYVYNKQNRDNRDLDFELIR